MNRLARFGLIAVAAIACKGSSKGSGGGSAATGSGSAAGSAATADPWREAAGSGAAATPPPKLDAALALDPSIRRGVLPNGLTYYVKANKMPQKRAQLWLAVNAGSVLEDDDQRGLAHMVEHLAFEGTKRFPKHDIQDFLERAGMKFGADLNAYTSFDETVYTLKVPTDDPAILSKGLDVLRDWAGDVSFDAKEVIDERKIIEEERRFRNTVGLRLARQMLPIIFAGGKYADRLPIGTTEVITGATAEQLTKFYQTWYRPDLMSVIVVGDLDPAAIQAEIEKRFADLAKPAGTAPPRPQVPVNLDHPPKLAVARDKEMALQQIELQHRLPRRPRASNGDFRRMLVEQMFGYLVQQRLEVITKRKEASWTGAGVGFGVTVRPVEELRLSALVKEGKGREAVADLVTELARVRQHGFSAEELRQGAAALLERFETAAREVDTRDSHDVADELLRNFLSGEAVPGPAAELALARAYLQAITSDELVAVAAAAADKGRVVVISTSDKAPVPEESAITEAIAAASTRQVRPWQAVDLSRPLLESEPTPGKVTSEEQLALGVTRWTLSNGARVYLKPTEFKKDEIQMLATSNGGYSAVTAKDLPQVRYAAEIANASGYGTYGVDDRAKKLAGKRADAEATVDDDHEEVKASASPDDLETMLQLVHATFTAPRDDAGAFDAWKAQKVQLANLMGANPQAKFFVAAIEEVYRNHPRLTIPLPLAKYLTPVDRTKALAQYRARMANAADFDFVFVGALTPATLRPLIERYVASLPGKPEATRERIVDVGIRPKAGKLARTIRAGTEDKAMSLLTTWTPIAHSIEVEEDAAILQRVLDLELLEVLREKLGGTYSVTIQVEADRKPPGLVSTILVFESSPARQQEMQDQAWKALDQLATTPVSEDTLAKVREQIRKKNESQREDNDYWLAVVGLSARFGDDLEKLVDVEKMIARVTPAHVQTLAGKLVSRTNRATMGLLPIATPAK